VASGSRRSRAPSPVVDVDHGDDDGRQRVPVTLPPGASGGGGRRPSGTVRAVADTGVITHDVLREAFLTMGGEMLGLARKTLYSGGLADDAVQETFARAWRSRRQFDPVRGSLRTWLFTIERRAILDLLEKQTRTATGELDGRDEPLRMDGLEEAIVSWQVGDALERLHEDHRQVLHELYFNGRTGPEVAALLEIPEGTVRSRAYYALKSLRVLLNEAGWER
jgi:RNA polymerase sigma-70 factor, ECF subfamily